MENPANPVESSHFFRMAKYGIAIINNYKYIYKQRPKARDNAQESPDIKRPRQRSQR